MPPKDIIPVLPDLSAGNRARDAESVLRSIEMLAASITKEWTDRSHSDPGVVLGQIFAYLFDHLLWAVDRGLTDSIITRTTRRSVAVPAAEALGYKVDGQTAATTTIKFSLPAPLGVALDIPKNTRGSGVYKGKTVIFETDVDAVIPVGALTVVVAASHGVSAQQVLDTSNSEPWQRYILSSTTIVKNRTQNTLVVEVGGVVWTEVPSFAQSVSSSTHYVVRRDHDDVLSVLFGDGSIGTIPGDGLAIVAKYRNGGGTEGNVPVDTIKTLVTVLAAAPLVTNNTQGQGGAVRQSLESIKLMAPAFFATQDRAVTSTDFDAMAGAVSGVLRVQAIRSALNHVFCRVVPNSWDGSVLNVALKASVLDSLNAKRMVTDVVSVYAAIPVRPRITVKVTMKNGQSRAKGRVDVEKALVFLYGQSKMAFGTTTGSYSLYLSDMVAAIDNTINVSHVDVTGFTRVPLLVGILTNGWDITAGGEGGASLGNVTVGAAAQAETWLIKFTTPNNFTVQGSVSGMQDATGTSGIPYVSDLGEVAFTVTDDPQEPGWRSMQVGNYGRFVTSKVNDNIRLAAQEHPVYVPDTDLDLSIIGGVP